MATDLIHDRGRGPELVGTRITVYNLLPDFLDPTITEKSICLMYELTPEQVAAARAYILSHPETVLAEHLKIEARMAAGNPPEVIEQAKQTRATFLALQRMADRARCSSASGNRDRIHVGGQRSEWLRLRPTFREWLAARTSRPVEGP